MKKAFCCFAVGISLTLGGCVSNPPDADMAISCKALEGEWTGSATGRIGGSMKIVFYSNCRYSWSGAFATDGSLTQQVSEHEFYYENRAGSRGTVSWSKTGSTLVYRNTYTGNNYVVEVRKSDK